MDAVVLRPLRTSASPRIRCRLIPSPPLTVQRAAQRPAFPVPRLCESRSGRFCLLCAAALFFLICVPRCHYRFAYSPVRPSVMLSFSLFVRTVSSEPRDSSVVSPFLSFLWLICAPDKLVLTPPFLPVPSFLDPVCAGAASFFRTARYLPSLSSSSVFL